MSHVCWTKAWMSVSAWSIILCGKMKEFSQHIFLCMSHFVLYFPDSDLCHISGLITNACTISLGSGRGTTMKTFGNRRLDGKTFEVLYNNWKENIAFAAADNMILVDGTLFSVPLFQETGAQKQTPA